VRTTAPTAPPRDGAVARPVVRALLGRALVVCCVVAVAVAAPVPLVGAAGEDCAEAATMSDGTLRVPIVVDVGALGGASGAESTCVTVAAGATGADVLRERARVLGRPAPRWAQSGLLCAIDGVPVTGCGERVDGSYRYWAYYLGGGGSWSWASIGPAFRKASPDRLEGWHFVAGTGGPSDPPPRASADPAAVCPSVATAPAPSAGPTGGDGGTGSSATSGIDSGGQVNSTPPTPVDQSGGAPNSAPDRSGSSTVADDDPSKMPDGNASGDERIAIAGADDPTGAREGDDAAAASNGEELASGRANPAPVGAPIGVLVAGALVIGVAAGGVVRARRGAA
jgi:hypothetical protein